MIADWNAFKAKHPNYQEAFEQLCYILFCREHNIKTGIFRYKNQTGVETEPIEVNGELNSWQAKFFDNEIDKEQITESIQKAQQKNPKLTKIYLYINKEFGESSKKDRKKPKKQKEIENFAKFHGIEIVWRVPSHIELQLSQPGNRDLSESYFSLGKTTYDSLEELFTHTQNLLEQIHTEIDFNEQKIKIDRASLLKKLANSLEKPSIVVLSGDGGTGKTALIKELYLKIREEIPIFVFKAYELNVFHINDFFYRYGTNFSLTDFIVFFKDIAKKVVVIDSAEKISDIENQEPIKEFISALIANNWSVIFTTRYEYFDDLVYTITELWAKVFEKIDIGRLTIEELGNFSNKYNFSLPTDEKVLQLIGIPFYLNEYLQNYGEIKGESVVEDKFKRLLWEKKIQGVSTPNQIKLKRENCFIEIAVKRANDLNFVVDDIECEERILKDLEEEGVIRFEKQQSGYFITQDIHEEWALERYIERSFNNSDNIQEFVNIIGDSLAVRRAFRKWLSENIKKDVNKVSPIIDGVKTDSIPQHWRDEIIVSIQRTPYSEIFYNELKDKILLDVGFLERAIFLTRIACKEVDNSLLKTLRMKPDQSVQLEYLMTQPRGAGWKALIKFLYENREILNLNTNIITGLLQDWVSKNKKGETTKYCGLLGIYLLKREYEKSQEDGSYYIDSNIEINISKIILNSANEIKEELQFFFDEILREDNYTVKSKYNKLVHLTLTSLLDFQEVIKALPEKVIELADKLWYQIPKREYPFYRSFEIEESFCLTSSYEFEYLPASVFQTPIYFLLKVKSSETLQFIVDFVNKTVECYANSELEDKIETVDVHIDGQVIKQYISTRLWNMYRGTGHPSPYLLQSIHMALEKWLLEIVKTREAKEIEDVCKDLLKNSKSASISAVITSIVLANPKKLRNTALILFKTKEFFIYDTARMLGEQEARNLYLCGKCLGRDIEKDILINERLKTCEDKHRKMSLENLMLHLQIFKEENNEHFEEYRDKIWKILDNYYSELLHRDKEKENNKTWRLFLARMDYRKQKIETKEHENGLMIEFRPQMDDELKKYSEESIKKSSESFKYLSLKLWSEFRFKNEKENYLKDGYKKYEDNPLLALDEIQKILDEFETNKTEGFFLFNKSIPIYVCAVLIRDFFEKLSEKQREFCKKIIFEYLGHSLSDNYVYQIGDGIDAAVSILPEMLQKYPNGNNEIKELITTIVFCGKREVINLSINNISNNLWKIDYNFAQSLFLGFLYLKPKYWNIFEELRRKQFSEKKYSEVCKLFKEQHKKELENIFNSNFRFFDSALLSTLDEHILINTFYLLPEGSDNELHVKFVTELSRIFCQKLFSESERLNYEVINRFLKKFTHFVLASKQENIDKYIQSFIENFKPSKYAKYIFEVFIFAEDYLNQYDNFWYIWNKFYGKIIKLSKDNCSRYYIEELLQNYLLAFPWKESAKEWHSLKYENKNFYRNVSIDIGHCPIVLYSISKVLNNIGSRFLDDGIYWISDMIKNHNEQLSKKVKNNTVYYLELLIRRYILRNRQLIKTDKRTKERILIILKFLINQGSSKAYLMREEIL